MNSGKHSPRRPETDSDLPGPVDPDQPDIPGPDEPDQPDVPSPDEPEQSPPPIKGNDARHDTEKQKENRRKLGVDDDHLTPEMKKHHRGTFP